MDLVFLTEDFNWKNHLLIPRRLRHSLNNTKLGMVKPQELFSKKFKKLDLNHSIKLLKKKIGVILWAILKIILRPCSMLYRLQGARKNELWKNFGLEEWTLDSMKLPRVVLKENLISSRIFTMKLLRKDCNPQKLMVLPFYKVEKKTPHNQSLKLMMD